MPMTPAARDILSVDPDQIPHFIQSHASSRTLSVMVRRLNSELVEGDASARRMAQKALERLGFVE